MLVAGGVDDDGDSLASAELYDPATGYWTPTGSLATARYGHTATLLPNGKVLVAGGYNYAERQHLHLASAELYDPATGAWTPTGSLATARIYHTATLLPNGQVLVAGGNATGSSAELYDPATGTGPPPAASAPRASVTPPRCCPTARCSSREATAWAFTTTPTFASAELYDPAPSFLNPSSTTPVKLGNGSFQLASSTGGGPSYSVLAGPDAAAPVNTWTNLGAATETPAGSGLVPVHRPAGAELSATLLPREPGHPTPAANDFISTASIGTAREDHTATLLPNGQVLSPEVGTKPWFRATTATICKAPNCMIRSPAPGRPPAAWHRAQPSHGHVEQYAETEATGT